MPLPILDPVYKFKPHDWSFSRIQQIAGKGELAPFPPEYKNPYVRNLAPRDQSQRGTCVGQSTAYCYDLLYMMLLKDLPTDSDRVQFRKDVTDAIGTLHDILYPQSASAEAFYQMSRKIGNVTYPAGSEIRFSARAWLGYGMNLESQWHTDKTGYCVWMMPPGPRVTSDGGVSPEVAAAFAFLHKSEGYAQVGTPGGNCTWDEVCSAIFAKGFVLGAIPVYENYASMAGGDGAFPNPSGELAGFHALCFYGYDSDTLYLVHSWGDWCGMYGSISKEFFRTAQDLIQFFVILDTSDVVIARGAYTSLTITCNIPATITVNGVVIGAAPQKIATEKGKTYLITVSADGYIARSITVDDSTTELHFVLEPLPLQPVKSWWQVIIEFLQKLFGR
jgi:hypothetical protein